VGADVGVEVLGEGVGEHGREWDGAEPCVGLGWAEVDLAAGLADGSHDVELAAVEVDGAAVQAGDLAPAQAEQGAEPDHGPVDLRVCSTRATILCGFTETPLLLADLGELDPGAGLRPIW
jgi:hypothetical protein